MPAPNNFWDRIAERYARRPVADPDAYERKLQKTRDYFRPDMEVLEFGCGTGSTAIAQAPHVRHIRATDLSEKMLEIARHRTSEAGVRNVSFEQTTIEGLHVRDASIDAVMGHSILHLVEDRDAVIAKVHRMLKPGGAFVSSTMCMADGYGWVRPFLAVLRYFGRVPLVKFFTASELVESLEAVGFSIDHQWQPGRGKAVFIVAQKAA